MLFEVVVTGRRFSDRGVYELRTTVEAASEALAAAHVEDYDWSDAAIRSVRIRVLDEDHEGVV